MSRLSDWIAAGRPWYLAQPLADLAGVLRRYGYVVGTLGDTSHLSAAIPEDHVPWSATGWPNPNPYPWVHAIDVMPPGGSLPSLEQLARQMVADRNAGLPDIAWLKYINYTAGACFHESWAPNHAQRPSSDVGHIHLSARTDHTHTGSSYDPVARLRGGPAPVTFTPVPESTGAAPTFPGRFLAYIPGRPMVQGYDVQTWQRRMCGRGWNLDADGVYGPKSATVCRQFQAEKHLRVDGVVGPQTWSAAWTAPVT